MFGDLKGFRVNNDMMTIVTEGVPAKVSPVGTGLDRAMRYGNHRSAADNLQAIWDKLGEDVQRQTCMLIRNDAAHQIPGLRVSSLGEIDTHKVWIINDACFEAHSRETQGRLNADTEPNTVAPMPMR